MCGCRLEDHDELQGMECLEQFNGQLARAVTTLKELGKWDGLVNSGGSSSHTLVLPSSAHDKQVRLQLMQMVLARCKTRNLVR